MAIPAPKNNSLLKNAWLIKCRSLIEYFDIPMAKAMYPSCEHVEYAMIRLMSFCLIPIVAAKKAVIVPIQAVIVNLTFLSSSREEDRISRKIPAVTIVAACIRAEMGVGPSIASGSQMCNPISDDFPMAPIRRSMQMLFMVNCVCVFCCICVRFSNFVLPNLFMMIMVLISTAMSPIRFMIMAFIPDLFACIRVYQKFINK